MAEQGKRVKYTVPDSGIAVTLRPVTIWTIQDGNAIVIERWRKAGRQAPPAVPTYEIETVAGDKEIHDHTADSVETPEEKAAWEKYIDEAFDFTNECGNEAIRILALRGIVDDPGHDWIEYCESLGIPMPERAVDRKIKWTLSWLCQSNEDLESLAGEVARISGINADLTQRAKENFRRKLEGKAA